MKRLLAGILSLCLLAVLVLPADAATMIRPNAAWYRVYFGTGVDHPVTSEEMTLFIDSIVTKRFPEGLSVIEAQGQWASPKHGLIKERTVIVEIQCEDTEENFEKIRNIASMYIKHFERAKASCFVKRIPNVNTILYFQ